MSDSRHLLCRAFFLTIRYNHIMEYNVSQITSLISKIHASTSSYLKDELKSMGMQEMVSSHGNILYQLSVYKQLTMKDLAARIHRDKSTTTVLVRKLENAGYIERQTSTTDNRVFFITLTQKGEEYTKNTSVISERLISRCYEGFSNNEKETLLALLNRVSNNFSE